METCMMSFLMWGKRILEVELVNIAKTCFFYSCLSLLTFLRMHVGVKLLPKGGAVVTTRGSTHTKTHFPTQRIWLCYTLMECWMEKMQGVFDLQGNAANILSIIFFFKIARWTFGLEGNVCEGSGCHWQIFFLSLKNLNIV